MLCSVCISVLLCHVSGVSSQEEVPVTVQPPSITVPPGAIPTFTCMYSVPCNADKITVQWYTYTQQHKLPLWTARTALNGPRSVNNSGYDRIRQVSSPATLDWILMHHSFTFSSIKPGNAGIYICEVSYNVTNQVKIGKAYFWITIGGNCGMCHDFFSVCH